MTETTTCTYSTENTEGITYDTLMELIKKFNPYTDTPQIESYQCHKLTYEFIKDKFSIPFSPSPTVGIFGVPVYVCQHLMVGFVECKLDNGERKIIKLYDVEFTTTRKR